MMKKSADKDMRSSGRPVRQRHSLGLSDSGFSDNRPVAVAQRKLQKSIDNSSRQVVQAQRLAGLFRSPVQRMRAEGIPVEANPAVAQRQGLEEEEPLQGRFDTAQLQSPEEEEPLQGRFDAVQRQGLEEEEPLQGKFHTAQRQGLEEEEPLQGNFESATAQTRPESGAAVSENHTGMPDQLKTGMERLSGMDLSDVRVRANSPEPMRLNAHAYAQGNDIHLGPGQEQHLPHEAWHVVQQRQGRVQATTQMTGVQINDDPGLEQEADAMGSKALAQGKQEREPI